jgi:hypothetical protein
MKAKETAILILILAQSGSTGLHAQGVFQNLDFESASVVNAPPYQPTMLPIAQVFPSWTAYYGTTPVTQVYFNGYSLGSALVTSSAATRRTSVGLSFRETIRQPFPLGPKLLTEYLHGLSCQPQSPKPASFPWMQDL